MRLLLFWVLQGLLKRKAAEILWMTASLAAAQAFRRGESLRCVFTLSCLCLCLNLRGHRSLFVVCVRRFMLWHWRVCVISRKVSLLTAPRMCLAVNTKNIVFKHARTHKSDTRADTWTWHQSFWWAIYPLIVVFASCSQRWRNHKGEIIYISRLFGGSWLN